MIKVYGVLKVANLFEEVFSTIQQIYHVCGLGTKIRWVWYQKILEPYRIIYILKIMWKTKSNYFVNIHIPIVCIVPCFSIIFLKSLTLTHLLVFTSQVILCVCNTSCFHDWHYNLFHLVAITFIWFLHLFCPTFQCVLPLGHNQSQDFSMLLVGITWLFSLNFYNTRILVNIFLPFVFILWWPSCLIDGFCWIVVKKINKY